MRKLFNRNQLLFLATIVLFLAACHRKTIPSSTLGRTGTLHTETGFASYYADKMNGHATASGELYAGNKSTAAHKRLPFGTLVKVTNLNNGKSVIVRVNDRGPFVTGRIIDLSRSAATAIGMLGAGVAKVIIQYRK